MFVLLLGLAKFSPANYGAEQYIAIVITISSTASSSSSSITKLKSSQISSYSAERQAVRGNFDPLRLY